MANNKELPENWKEIALELFYNGASGSEIRRALSGADGKFSVTRWYALKKKDKEFNEMLEIGLELSKGWWEAAGRLNLKEDGFNHVLWFMNMKNRFPDNWKDVNRNVVMNVSPEDKSFRDQFFGVQQENKDE